MINLLECVVSGLENGMQLNDVRFLFGLNETWMDEMLKYIPKSYADKSSILVPGLLEDLVTVLREDQRFFKKIDFSNGTVRILVFSLISADYLES